MEWGCGWAGEVEEGDGGCCGEDGEGEGRGGVRRYAAEVTAAVVILRFGSTGRLGSLGPQLGDTFVLIQALGGE